MNVIVKPSNLWGEWSRVARGVPSKVKLIGVGFPLQRDRLTYFGGFNLRFIDLVQTEISLIMRW